MTDREWTLRAGTAEDLPLLTAMLEEAVFWQPVPRTIALADLEVADILDRYVEQWGRADDVAVVGVDHSGRGVGAAWYRLFPEDAPGFGFVAAEVPELSIGIVEEFRGVGLGRAMIEALFELARQAGIPGISLSVEIANSRAVRLYRNLGFEIVHEDEGNYTMLARLDRGSS